MLATNGVVTPETLCEALPPARFSGKGPLAVIECFQSIPCNPCVEACPRGARVYGNLKDPDSPVRRILHERRYSLLKPEMGTNPKCYYLGLDLEVK